MELFSFLWASPKSHFFGKYAAGCGGDPWAIADFGLGLKSVNVFSSVHDNFGVQLFDFTLDLCFELQYSNRPTHPKTRIVAGLRPVSPSEP